MTFCRPNRHGRRLLFAHVAAACFSGVALAEQVCEWQGTSGGSLESLAVFNGELYAGGLFTQVGDTPANHIARWNGTVWAGLGNGRNNIVFAMLVYDDDAGGPNPPALFTGGLFSTAGLVSANNVAKWNGTTWSAVGDGTDLGGVNALAEFNGDLYAAGDFQAADGNTANRIAKWDGVAWTDLSGPAGNGLNSSASAMAVHNDGSGSKLYVGGNFVTAGGLPANRIARWNGFQWEPVGAGMNGNVLALAEYNGDLYAGGSFTTADGSAAPRVARWNGSSWTNVGAGMTGISAFVSTLVVHDDGSGAKLYAGGAFDEVFGVAGTANLAKWDGVAWSSVGNGTDGAVLAMVPGGGNPGLGSGLFAGGSFGNAGGVVASCLADWDAVTWSAVGKCIDLDCNDNGTPDDEDIANGDSTDCNLNQIPDECDLEEPFTDLNFNGILDECEPDCNENGLPDDLDIQLGSSDDDNNNGIPDECESCDGDSDGDGFVNVNDLNNVILDWGTDGSANGGDLTGAAPGSPPDGLVNVNDLNAVIVNWGACPLPLEAEAGRPAASALSGVRARKGSGGTRK